MSVIDDVKAAVVNAVSLAGQSQIVAAENDASFRAGEEIARAGADAFDTDIVIPSEDGTISVSTVGEQAERTRNSIEIASTSVADSATGGAVSAANFIQKWGPWIAGLVVIALMLYLLRPVLSIGATAAEAVA